MSLVIRAFAEAAHAAAYTPEQAIAAERNHAVRTAAALVIDGRPGRAQYELARSVMRQARIAGLGQVEIQPACPCGGRCRP